MENTIPIPIQINECFYIFRLIYGNSITFLFLHIYRNYNLDKLSDKQCFRNTITFELKMKLKYKFQTKQI